MKVEISDRIKHEFETLPKRWRVERTFSWLNNYRRLSKDYKIMTTFEESYVEISSIALLLRRLFKA
ncbi:MAG: transposase [Myxococcales bacterium]|nr:transposase [Myxococcales bacterium]